eukprot:CAMPEP_0175778276 /NCGR_PEP_ID=MMETSP0097-20121207/75612_1 /TAXON_ID=311494 /ORGANISM="Alexandrium monilatum, Strain CCMP3105" /LENGTH=66 /DNA_ID=CAMNT_0017088917 /DNA_START=96 /DNA_END=292 /DNA_ORIENTATION=-
MVPARSPQSPKIRRSSGARTDRGKYLRPIFHQRITRVSSSEPAAAVEPSRAAAARACREEGGAWKG